jgi:hypothetical protein
MFAQPTSGVDGGTPSVRHDVVAHRISLFRISVRLTLTLTRSSGDLPGDRVRQHEQCSRNGHLLRQGNG